MGQLTAILTWEHMEQGRSKRGSWNHDQLATIGVKLPLRTGWLDRVIGSELAASSIATFIELKDSHLKKRAVKKRSVKKQPTKKKIRSKKILNNAIANPRF